MTTPPSAPSAPSTPSTPSTPPKPAPPLPDPNVVEIHIRDPNQRRVSFRVRRTTKFHKIERAFCANFKYADGTVRLLYDGERIGPDATPDTLSLEDGDVIEAYLEQIGGVAAFTAGNTIHALGA